MEPRVVHHAVDVAIAHGDRPPADMRRDIGLEPRKGIVAAHLACARARDAARVDLRANAALPAKALQLERFVAPLLEREENEFCELRPRAGKPVQMLAR